MAEVEARVRYLESWPDPPESVFALAAAIEWAQDGDPDAVKRVMAADEGMRQRAWAMHEGPSISAQDWARFLNSADSWTDGS